MDTIDTTMFADWQSQSRGCVNLKNMLKKSAFNEAIKKVLGMLP